MRFKAPTERRSKISLIPAVILALCFLSVSASAEYKGPGPAPETVAGILKNPKDDHPVVLQGVILRKVAPERYVFSDGTGEIHIEIEDDEDVFPVQPIDDKTKVEISGEVDKDFRRAPEIDVESIRIIEG